MSTNKRRRRVKLPTQVLDIGKSRTNLCLPTTMLDTIHHMMDNDGVSRKKRSQWIEQAVCNFFELPNYEELILEEFIDSGSNVKITITLGAAVKHSIDKVIQQLSQRTKRPAENSALLRAAISQQLIRRKRKVGL